MSSNFKMVFIAILGLAIGYFVGNAKGNSDGYQECQQIQKSKSIAELRSELREAEQKNILSLIDGTAKVQRVDEGGLFKVKYVNYLQGKINNNASVATIKDIKLKIDFFSKTQALVNSRELTVYDFIQPNKEYNFKERLDWPSGAETFSFTVIDAKVE